MLQSPPSRPPVRGSFDSAQYFRHSYLSVRAQTRVDQISRLFRQTLTYGYDDKKPWAAVHRLRRTGSRLVFDRAAVWCTSSSPIKRARAAEILSQLYIYSRSRLRPPYAPVFVTESFALLSRMLAVETNDLALISEIHALGHRAVDGTVTLVLPYATHPNQDIRYAATHALGQFHTDPAALETLIALSADTDRDVRNWATFYIGTQSNADSPEIREALVRRLKDPFPDARGEGIAGLAKRKDERAVLPLFKLLRAGRYFVHHEYDFAALLEVEPPPGDWSTETLIDALYLRFPTLLPPRQP
jgi:hypothetical protein